MKKSLEESLKDSWKNPRRNLFCREKVPNNSEKKINEAFWEGISVVIQKGILEGSLGESYGRIPERVSKDSLESLEETKSIKETRRESMKKFREEFQRESQENLGWNCKKSPDINEGIRLGIPWRIPGRTQEKNVKKSMKSS